MQTPIREIMATTSKDTSIRIKESTRFRLDMLKGNKSHDAFVAEMLLYFETTGITPQSNVMPPNIAAKEQASRVIAEKAAALDTLSQFFGLTKCVNVSRSCPGH